MVDIETKLQKTIHLIKEKGLDGLIVYSDGTCSILRPSYLYYFSGYKPMGPNNAAVVTSSGDVVLLVEPPWDKSRASKKSFIPEIVGTGSFTSDIKTVLDRMGLSGTVGVAGYREMSAPTYAALSALVDIEPADDIIETMAQCKSSQEVAVVEKVAAYADVGFNAFLDNAREGIREFELAAQMEYAMRSAGADDIFILLSSGRRNHEMHEPTDRRLQSGDVLIGEITPVLEGQFFQLCRTVVLGEASENIKEKYALLIQALKKTLAVVKAGIPASLISKTVNGVLIEAGYEKYCYPPYMRARGHGFGPGSLAPGGVIDDNTTTELIKDQVVVIHPNQWLPETGYMACGGTYMITNNGYTEFSRSKTRLYTKEV